jgi:ABC-2 type transport system permease protein
MSDAVEVQLSAPVSTIFGPPIPRRQQLADLAALTWTLSRKNFQVRYKRAVLGVVWAVLQPAFQAAVLSLVFIRVFKAGTGVDHFPVFVLSGLLPWAFFSQSMSVATVSIVDNGSLVKKVPIPLMVFPLSAIGGTAMAFAAALPVLLVAGVVVGTVGWQLLLLPLAVLLQLLAVVGIATLCASFYPAFRDIRYLVESALLVGLYLTPVLYPPEQLPPVLRDILRFNPLTGVLSLYRAVFLSREVEWSSVGASVLVGVVMLAIGTRVFARRSDEFPDLV